MTATAVTAAPPAARRWPRAVLLGGLGVAVVLASLVAAAVGAYDIGLDEVVATALRPLGIDLGVPVAPVAQDVLLQVRFPRVVLGLAVGAALGCAGALLQGMFRNPLAEPGVIGVSAGAAVGAVLVIAVGLSALGTWTLPLAAFGGGIVATLGVYAASRAEGRVETVTLVLTGIAVNALAGALIGVMTFFSSDAQLRSITFWSLGSLGTATWAKTAVAAPLVVLGVLVAIRFAGPLDLLALGERSARHLGVDVEQVRRRLVLVVALLTGSAVAVAGIVGFVGLIVPHVVRLVAGPRHAVLLPASALGGALVLVLGDLTARTVAAPAELPLGVLTALLGAPTFLLLLRRTRAEQGGWA